MAHPGQHVVVKDTRSNGPAHPRCVASRDNPRIAAIDGRSGIQADEEVAHGRELLDARRPRADACFDQGLVKVRTRHVVQRLVLHLRASGIVVRPQQRHDADLIEERAKCRGCLDRMATEGNGPPSGLFLLDTDVTQPAPVQRLQHGPSGFGAFFHQVEEWRVSGRAGRCEHEARPIGTRRQDNLRFSFTMGCVWMGGHTHTPPMVKRSDEPSWPPCGRRRPRPGS